MLGKNILSTIAYYDVMDYPLTLFEVWKHLICFNQNQAKKFSLEEVQENIEENENLKNFVENYQGYYFLKGRKNLVSQRIERNKISENKQEKIRKICRWLRVTPYVRMIAATGRVAMKNADRSSDLDLLVVLKSGHIFTGRLFFTLLTHLLGKRRYGEKIKDRICLNYFISDQSLKIAFQDVFSASEYSMAIPLFGFSQFQEFQRKNIWIKNFKPNFSPADIPDVRLLEENKLLKIIRQALETMLSFQWIEKSLKKWQLKRIEKNPKTHQEGSMVVADDKMLVFLPFPQGPKIFEKFKEKLKFISESA